MGVDLLFINVGPNDEGIGPDREGLAAWMRKYEVEFVTIPGDDRHLFLDRPNGPPLPDDWLTDLEFVRKAPDGPPDHAFYRPRWDDDEEIRLIYEFCVATKFTITHPEAFPGDILLRETHTPDELPEHFRDSAIWVSSPDELRQALDGEHEDIPKIRARILEAHAAANPPKRRRRLWPWGGRAD